MALVHIDNLTPGMVLKGNICDRSGRLLLPAGSELIEKHFSIFRMWGVLEADIVGDAVVVDETDLPLNDELDPVLVAAAHEEVERLFVHNDPEHPAIKELMRLCIERRAVRAS